MNEIPLFDNFYKNEVLKELFRKNSKLENFHNGLNLDRINEKFLNNVKNSHLSEVTYYRLYIDKLINLKKGFLIYFDADLYFFDRDKMCDFI